MKLYVAERRRLIANALCIFGAHPIDRTDVQLKVTLLKAIVLPEFSANYDLLLTIKQ